MTVATAQHRSRRRPLSVMYVSWFVWRYCGSFVEVCRFDVDDRPIGAVLHRQVLLICVDFWISVLGIAYEPPCAIRCLVRVHVVDYFHTFFTYVRFLLRGSYSALCAEFAVSIFVDDISWKSPMARYFVLGRIVRFFMWSFRNQDP